MSSEHGASKKKQNRYKPMVATTNSASEDDGKFLKVSLSSISKVEVKNLKRKFKAELEDVRSLIKRVESVSMVKTGNKKVKTGNVGGKKGGIDKGMAQILKNCNNLLTKLMKHKNGWVFNEPVDAKVMGLHDYHSIVKEPMDLGTIKSKLAKSVYKSPLEFAEDVRLTFDNAILYNPVEHEVNVWAKLLLGIFEEKWVVIEGQYDNYLKKLKPVRDIELPRPVPMIAPPVVEPLPAPTPSPTPPTPSMSPPPPPPVLENKTFERAESMTTAVEPEPVAVAVAPEKLEEEETPVTTRDLTLDEKRRLSEDLQDLPYDRLEVVVQIIKKRNPELSQQDDEIELDIDSVDLETLWELYRFVTGYKDSLSKKKEDQEVGSEKDAESAHNTIQEPTGLVTGTKTSRGTESGKAIRPSSPSRSSNSSSSDSGSCSSDSDSDSSSGRGSDTGN